MLNRKHISSKVGMDLEALVNDMGGLFQSMRKASVLAEQRAEICDMVGYKEESLHAACQQAIKPCVDKLEYSMWQTGYEKWKASWNASPMAMDDALRCINTKLRRER